MLREKGGKRKPIKVSDGSQIVKIFLMVLFAFGALYMGLKIVGLLEKIAVNTS